MKKIIVLSTLSLVLAACGDEHADLRKLTVEDYLNNKELLSEVSEKCHNSEIKDEEICKVAIKAVNRNFDWR